MKFVASRELRINPGAVWTLLREEKDVVVTSNGKPIGVLTIADEDSLEDVLATLRRGRAQAAVAQLRRTAVSRGLDRLTDDRVHAIIKKTRRAYRVHALPLAIALPDPDDVKFLEVAVTAGSSTLVTGNLRHYPADQRHGVRVSTPREFLGAWAEGLR